MGLQPGPTDKCYDFNLNLQKTFAWDLSQETCKKYGMNLASVSTSEESEWVNQALFDSYLFSDGNQAVDGTWIGYRGKFGDTTDKNFTFMAILFFQKNLQNQPTMESFPTWMDPLNLVLREHLTAATIA